MLSDAVPAGRRLRTTIQRRKPRAVEIAPTHLGSSSITLHAVVKSLDGKTVYAEGHTRLVRLDPSTNRPCPWSQPFRDKMEKLVRQSVVDQGA